MPIAATGSDTQIFIEFDRNVTLADNTTAVWSAPPGDVNIVTQITPTIIRLQITAFVAPTQVSYSPPPNAVVGDPDGVPVQAFADFPIVP